MFSNEVNDCLVKISCCRLIPILLMRYKYIYTLNGNIFNPTENWLIKYRRYLHNYFGFHDIHLSWLMAN